MAQLKKLHLGCSNSNPGPIGGWDNLDIKKWNTKIIQHDLRKPLPYKARSVSACFSCHTLEHLTRDEGYALLKECYRVLDKNMPIRIVVPDLDIVLRLPNKKEIVKALYEPDSKAGPHKYMYDENLLRESMEQIGFKNVTRTDWRNQYSNYVVFQSIGSFHVESLAIEGIKG